METAICRRCDLPLGLQQFLAASVICFKTLEAEFDNVETCLPSDCLCQELDRVGMHLQKVHQAVQITSFCRPFHGRILG